MKMVQMEPKSKTVNKGKSSNKNTQKPITTMSRNAIGANWQSFLATQKKDEEKKKHNPKPERACVEKYTGPFRRVLKHEQMLLKLSLDSSITSMELPNEAVESKKHLPQNKSEKMSKYVAIDCEMVGIGDGNENMLARVSLVNKEGDCIYDKFVKPREAIVDYRTPVSGVRKEDLADGEEFDVVVKEVAAIIQHRILVGHALRHDMEVLFLSHPRRHIRDTSRYKPFRSVTKGHTPSLKRLAKELLGVEIQGGEHSSVEDAKAAMQLYIMHSKEWERSLKSRKNKD